MRLMRGSVVDSIVDSVWLLCEWEREKEGGEGKEDNVFVGDTENERESVVCLSGWERRGISPTSHVDATNKRDGCYSPSLARIIHIHTHTLTPTHSHTE